MAPPGKSLESRFHAKVKLPADLHSCWAWVGATRLNANGSAYGVIGEGGREGKNLSAHRVSYELHNGPIPDGMVILHSCDTPLCVNPAHLSVGTHQRNMDDMVRKHRSVRRAGEANPRARLTADAVTRILTMYHGGSMSVSQIAEQVGVSRQAVNHITSGRRWKHLQEGK